MTTKEVADQLVNLCRTGQWQKAQDDLYADNAVSLEMPGSPFPERTEGRDAIKAKGARWESMVEEVHGMTLEGPIVAGPFITCSMNMDITMKGMPRSQNEQICVYKVEDGKVVSEQFFY